jgi:hypothetical protein
VAEPSPRVRQQVIERDDWTCLGCGKDIRSTYWYSLQHRKARGQGGSNGPENIVLLCGSATSQGCHLLCEARDPEMQARGLVVPSWNDPLTTPVVLWTGRSVFLTTNGTYEEAA